MNPTEVADRLLTAEDFAELEEGPGRRLELVGGKVVEVDVPGGRHGDVASDLVVLLKPFARAQALGWVTVETGFLLDRDPDLVRVPDVAFVVKERVPQPLPEGYVALAPDLAIEVVSPRDTYDELHAKIEEYLAYGVGEAWVVDPARARVEVHRRGARPEFVTRGMGLQTPLFPGLTISLGVDLFPPGD